jgi:glucose-6-phosphate isomerase
MRIICIMSQVSNWRITNKNVLPDIHRVLEQMKTFQKLFKVVNGKIIHGKVITDVVNIGIGGWDLGLLMVTKALKVKFDQVNYGILIYMINLVLNLINN